MQRTIRPVGSGVPRCVTVLVLAGALCASGQTAPRATESDPFADLDARPARKPPVAFTNDPFADLDAPRSPRPASLAPPGGTSRTLTDDIGKSFLQRFLDDGFAFKKEIMLEVSRSSFAARQPGATAEGLYSRQSVGFEILKKFSTDTATVAAFDVQVRLVRRDNFHEVQNDAEGANRLGWALEYHNLYWDFYNVLNPLLGDEARSDHTGRFNFRVGRFYLPFGLNLQTDTHGPILQLSNERNFGFERDWYAGLWGSLNPHLNYDCYYLAGSGYDLAFPGQQGLLGARLSLSTKYLNEYGLEAGVSFLGGERVSQHALDRSPSVAMSSRGHNIVETLRYGGDVRWQRPIPTGSVTLTAELSAGRDERDALFTQLYQADYLTRNRKFGATVQHRRFQQDIRGNPAAAAPMGGMMSWNGGSTDASVTSELTWYFRNDLGNANLRWLKLNVERATESQRGRLDTTVTVQYYHYW